MPTLSFNITQERFDKTIKAIEAYNTENPQDIVIDENDFAKKAFVESLQVYLVRYRMSRVASVADQLTNCSDSTWNQITGLLGA